MAAVPINPTLPYSTKTAAVFLGFEVLLALGLLGSAMVRRGPSTRLLPLAVMVFISFAWAVRGWRHVVRLQSEGADISDGSLQLILHMSSTLGVLGLMAATYAARAWQP